MSSTDSNEKPSTNTAEGVEGDIKSDTSKDPDGIPSFDDLARIYAQNEVRRTLMPHITQVFMAGHPFVDFSASERFLPFIAAVLKDKGFTTEPVASAPSPPGVGPRPGLRIFLHAKPGDKIPEPPQKPQKANKHKK